MLFLNFKKLNQLLIKQYNKLTPMNEVNLHRNLIGVFTCILAFSLLIYIVIIYPLDGDKASSLASIFGFSATLFAPIAALFLLDNWKDQAKYSEQINCLTAIHKNLHDIRNNIINIREQDNFFYFHKLVRQLVNNNKEHINVEKLRIKFEDYYFKEIEKSIREIMFYNSQLAFITNDPDFNLFGIESHHLERKIKGLNYSFVYFQKLVPNIDFSLLQDRDFNSELKQIIQKAAYCNNQFKNLDGIEYLKFINEKDHTKDLFDTLDKMLNLVLEYRKTLN